MKKESFVLIILIVFLAVTLIITTSAWAQVNFRCGTRLVQVGDTKDKVYQACGKPTINQEGRLGTGGADVWYYNFGTNKRSVILKFTGSKLYAISYGSFGFSTPPEER